MEGLKEAFSDQRFQRNFPEAIVIGCLIFCRLRVRSVFKGIQRCLSAMMRRGSGAHRSTTGSETSLLVQYTIAENSGLKDPLSFLLVHPPIQE